MDPLFTLDPLDLHSIDITIRVIAQHSLIRAFHASSTASLRLSGANRASEPAPSDPGYPRISVPAPPLTPAHLRSASRLPAWACRPSPGSRSALTSRTAEQRHRPPTRHANCNPPSALPWVGAARCGRTSRPVAQRAEATHARRQLPGFESAPSRRRRTVRVRDMADMHVDDDTAATLSHILPIG